MNEILENTKKALLEKVDQRLLPVLDKVVDSGRQVMYSDDTREIVVRELQQAQDPEGIGAAVAKLLAILANQSRGTIPPKILFPAGMVLLVEALDFLEEAGAVQVTPELLAQCAQALGSAFLQSLGVTPDKLSQMLGSGGADGAGPAPAPGPAQQPAGGIVAAAQGA